MRQIANSLSHKSICNTNSVLVVVRGRRTPASKALSKNLRPVSEVPSFNIAIFWQFILCNKDARNASILDLK